MDAKKLEKSAELGEFAGYIANLSQSTGHGHSHGGDGSIETSREDDYEGHHIEIQTTYKIKVDGEILQAPIGLDNEGNLHCHSLPNYQFTSAIDMVRRLIDNFPEDFKRKRAAKKPAGKRSSKKSPGGHNHGSHKHATKGRK
ncbi:MAG TPA: hypothetical protein VER76_05425 [Pyrinomonadaceae bacterium]|nr:hypothetical protein [Pyrinomonadaceae bacterium]